MSKQAQIVAALLAISTCYAFSFSPSSTSRLFRPQPSLALKILSESGNYAKMNNSQPWRSRRRRKNHNISTTLSAAAASEDEPIGSGSTTTATNVDEKDDQLSKLKKENELLQQRLKLLQVQNDELIKQQKQTSDSNEKQKQSEQRKKKKQQYEQRLILEDFEGEGIPTLDARGGVVDGWNRDEKRYTEPWDDDKDGEPSGGEYVEFEVEGETKAVARIGRIAASSDETIDDDELGLSEIPIEDNDEVCEIYDDTTNKWIVSPSSIGECPVEPNVTFMDAMKSRAYWLVGLLAMQSCSGFILSRNELLLQDHPVIIYFLTMLVGAGGNAGNQASVRVIRGLGEYILFIIIVVYMH